MPSKDKNYNKKYYQKNKEKIREKARQKYQDVKDSLTDEQKQQRADEQKEYYTKNKNKILERNKPAQRIWYEKNKSKILQKAKDWRLKVVGTLKYRFKRAKYQAKNRDILFELSFEDFENIANNSCYYCNNELCNPVLDGSGLDRLDSNKGYEINNVVSCGGRCNLLKNDDLTMEEAKAAISAILQIRKIKEYEKNIKE